jgi:adenine-specific DNA-methyltransferase
MPRIKDIPQIDRPREKFLQKGPDALSKTELLAILLGSGIKGKNVKQISEHIIKKFGRSFLDITVDDLLKIPGIGQAKALQIAAAVFLVKRFYEEEKGNEIIIKNPDNVFSLTYDLRDKKKEYIVCLYLNARNILIKKETISIGLLDKSLLHPREIFYSAVELNSASIILVHNHPSGDPAPSTQDVDMVGNIAKAGEIMGIPVLDFIITASNGNYSFFKTLKDTGDNLDYLAEGVQKTLFALLEIEKPVYDVKTDNEKICFHSPSLKNRVKNGIKNRIKNNSFRLHNRRYLGNKYKLLGVIEDIVSEKCGEIESFCDIFAGTGVVGERFNSSKIKIISNDFLFLNYVCLKAFLCTKINIQKLISNKINYLNNLKAEEDNYFSKHFGGTYFSIENAKKIGAIREEIEKFAENEEEKNIFICSLIYAVDKVANTVGHYDAFRQKLDMLQPIKLLLPDINYSINENNEIYRKDANALIREIYCDVLYIDPPYNSRQYSDAYHLLENLAQWKKPEVFGIGKKMDRSHIKSDYCVKKAAKAFKDLIDNADCRHILLSYNNTGESKDGRSNARINDDDIVRILKSKGEVEIFKRSYKAFTTGKSDTKGNFERIFYCKVD